MEDTNQSLNQQNPIIEPTSAQSEKTFTQDEVSRMLANEKRQGRSSVLRELGINPEDKDSIKAAKEALDSHRTEAERIAATLKAEQDAKTEALHRAAVAEQKLNLLQNGCATECIEEVAILVSAKVSDTVDFDAALKAVKEKFPSFFTASAESVGTGKGQGHRKPIAGKPGEFGARLAGDTIRNSTEKNPYFTN